jgi:hypothetical protein
MTHFIRRKSQISSWGRLMEGQAAEVEMNSSSAKRAKCAHQQTHFHLLMDREDRILSLKEVFTEDFEGREKYYLTENGVSWRR